MFTVHLNPRVDHLKELSKCMTLILLYSYVAKLVL